jgi:hypothetical protein
MRKNLNLIPEPLNIEALFEQTIYFPILFCEGSITNRMDISDFEAELTVWKNNPSSPILECTTSGPADNKITKSSSLSDSIIDKMTILSDFLQTSPTNAAPPPDEYKYRLNIVSPDGVDVFVLNGKFIIYDVAPDDYVVPTENPNTVLFNQTIIQLVLGEILPSDAIKTKPVANNTELQDLIDSGFIGDVAVENFLDENGNTSYARISITPTGIYIIPTLQITL